MTPADTCPVPIAALAGSIAATAYLNAKFLIRHDLSVGSLAGSVEAAAFIAERTKQDRILAYRESTLPTIPNLWANVEETISKNMRAGMSQITYSLCSRAERGPTSSFSTTCKESAIGL